MDSHDALVQEQREREVRDTRSAMEKYDAGYKKNPMGSRPVANLLERAILALRDRLKDEREALAGRSGGATSRAIRDILTRVDAEKLAFITAHAVLHAILQKREKPPTLATVGHAVSDDLVENVMRVHTGYKPDRDRILWTLIEGPIFDIQPFTWPESDRESFGIKLAVMLAETESLIQITQHGHEPHRVSLLPEVDEWLASENDRLKLMHPARNPMVTMPDPWDSEQDGGFLTERLQAQLILGHKPRASSSKVLAETPHIQEGLNYLQRVQWQINRAVLDVASRRKHTNARDRLQIVVAKDLQDREAIYFPWRVDYRGRFYPVSDSLNPDGGGDLSRGLLQFARSEPLGKRGRFWLAVHIGNTYGREPACGKRTTLDQRAKWTADNAPNFKALLDLPDDDPASPKDRWQFLAGALEWQAMLRHGNHETFESRIPVMLDGRCNGIQHFAALTLSEHEGELAGITPSAKPNDLYLHLADLLKKKLAGTGISEEIADRVFIKAVMQPWAYGSDVHESILRPKSQLIIDRLNDARLKWDDKMRLAKIIEGIVRKELRDTRKLMEWLKKAGQKMQKAGRKSVSWMTPSGWEVDHTKTMLIHAQKLRISTVRTRGKPMQVTLRGTPAFDKKRFSTALPPSFIHSLDAAHLALTIKAARIQGGVHSIACVHDCYGTHAGMVDILRDTLRKVFASSEFLDGGQAMIQRLAKLSRKPPLPLGKLVVSKVVDSDYFFD